MSLQDIVNEDYPRSQYTKEILMQLDNFSMNDVVNFHLMNDIDVLKKMLTDISKAVINADKEDFAKVAAMCIICMERVDLRKIRNYRKEENDAGK